MNEHLSSLYAYTLPFHVTFFYALLALAALYLALTQFGVRSKNYVLRIRYFLPIYKHGLHGEPIAISRDGSTPAGMSKIGESAGRYNFFNTNIYSSYTKQIKKHTATILGGFQSELEKTHAFSASRDGLYSPEALSINTTGGKEDDVSGSNQHWATAGFFARLNYNYDGKYLLEDIGIIPETLTIPNPNPPVVKVKIPEVNAKPFLDFSFTNGAISKWFVVVLQRIERLSFSP